MLCFSLVKGLQHKCDVNREMEGAARAWAPAKAHTEGTVQQQQQHKSNVAELHSPRG